MPLDLAAVRDSWRPKPASSTGGRWKSWPKIRNFEQLLHREFPRQASEWDDAVDRRDFLKLMAASLAFAGLSGCGKAPEEHIVPYVKQPDGLVLGKPQFYATAMPFGADAIGVLVESHEGRPTNIQGNPDHPSSLGAIDSFVQASILDLYDPDRSQVPNYVGEISSVQAFRDAAQATASAMKTMTGEGLPHSDRNDHVAADQRADSSAGEALSQSEMASVGASGQRWRARRLQDGFRPLHEYGLPPGKSGSDSFAGCGFHGQRAGHIRYMKQFYRRRKLDNDARGNEPAVRGGAHAFRDGATADHRLPLRSSDVGTIHARTGGENWIGWNDGAGSRGAALDGYGSRRICSGIGALRW